MVPGWCNTGCYCCECLVWPAHPLLGAAPVRISHQWCQVRVDYLKHSQEEEQRTVNGFHELLLNIRLLNEEEYQLLGCPLTLAAAIPVLQRKHEELQGIIKLLKPTDSHPALWLYHPWTTVHITHMAFFHTHSTPASHWWYFIENSHGFIQCQL